MAYVQEALAEGGQGYVVIRSRALGEDVLWTRDDAVVPPDPLATLVRYSWEELGILSDFGLREALCDMHLVKKTLGGRPPRALHGVTGGVMPHRGGLRIARDARTNPGVKTRGDSEKAPDRGMAAGAAPGGRRGASGGEGGRQGAAAECGATGLLAQRRPY